MRPFRAVMSRAMAAAAVAAVLVAACAETVVQLPSAATLVVNTNTLALTAGDNNVALSASVLDGNGRPLNPQPPFLWSSSSPSVASVTAGGSVAPLAPGTATVTVSAGSLSETVTVTVGAPTLRMNPRTLQMLPNQQANLTATVRNAQGRDMSAGTITHVIEDRTIAAISFGSGTSLTVTALAEGNTRIFSSNGYAADTTTIAVLRSANDLVTAINIVPDSVGGTGQPALFSLLPTTDQALVLDWTATNAAGADRCATVANQGVILAASRNPAVVGGVTVQTTVLRCQITLTGIGQPGETYVVMQVNNLRDSVRVIVRPNIASINIIPDSVTFDNSTATDQLPLLPYVVLNPRGQNYCSNATIQGQLAIVARNATVGSATQLGVAPGTATCNLRVVAGGGTTPASAWVVLTTSTPGGGSTPRDSVLLRQGTAAFQFRDPAALAQSLAAVGDPTQGDTLRAGQVRTLSIVVTDRDEAPVAGANVTLALSGNLAANFGTLDRNSATTGANGVATFQYTAPAVLNSAGSAAATQNVTFTFSGVAPNGAAIATGTAANGVTRVIYALPASRLVVFRPNPLNANDTTTQVTTATTYQGGADRWQYRAFDANNNRVLLVNAAPTNPAQQRLLLGATLADRATLGSAVAVGGLDLLTTWNVAGDSTPIVASVGSASSTVQLLATRFPLGLWYSATQLTALTTPFANATQLGSILTYSIANANATVNVATAAYTGHPDTVSFSANVDANGFRGYLRAANGTQAAVALAVGDAITSPLTTGAAGTGGRPFTQMSFLPSATTRGRAYFISDSVAAGDPRSRLWRREPASDAQLCVDNTNRYIVYNGVSISPDGTNGIVTTRVRTAPEFSTPQRGTAADSTRFSQVYSLVVATCELTLLTNTQSNAFEYRRPIWINNSTAMIELFNGAQTTLHSVTAGSISGALATAAGDFFLSASKDPTQADGVIYTTGGAILFGRLPTLAPYNAAPLATFGVASMFSRR